MVKNLSYILMGCFFVILGIFFIIAGHLSSSSTATEPGFGELFRSIGLACGITNLIFGVIRGEREERL